MQVLHLFMIHTPLQVYNCRSSNNSFEAHRDYAPTIQLHIVKPFCNICCTQCSTTIIVYISIVCFDMSFWQKLNCMRACGDSSPRFRQAVTASSMPRPPQFLVTTNYTVVGMYYTTCSWMVGARSRWASYESLLLLQ